MIIDGEKWACEACVRGHRVSNCQHADRPLQHINKKGRPVSQCQHCRTMRRSKAAHVKCDCGEKSSKCMHLKNTVDGHKDSCCCNHGGRCTCCHKKDLPHLDTVPESDSEEETSSNASSQSHPKASRGSTRIRRSRANTQNSDGMLTFDEHGHHKPTYKHTKASQKSGPYQLNRVNSVQSTRSVDGLGRESPAGPDGALQDQRLVKSEAASPLMTGSSSFSEMNGQLPPLDLSEINYTPYVSDGGISDNFDLFGSYDDHERPMYSAGLGAAPVDWSHYNLDSVSRDVNDFAPSNFSQSQSFGGFDPHMAQSTSGEISEVEDLVPSARDEFDPTGSFSRTSTNSTGFSLPPAQAELLASLDLLNGTAFNEFKNAGSMPGDGSTLAAPVAPDLGGFSMVEDALWITEFNYPPTNESPADPNAPVFWDM